MEPIIREFQEVDAHWTKQEDETISALQELLQTLESDHGNALTMIADVRNVAQIDNNLREKLTQQPDQWKSLHAHISKFSKVLDKKLQNELVDLVDVNKLDQVPHKEAICQAIMQHFYREGNFEAGDSLASELQSPTEASLKEPFEEMHRLSLALSNRNISPVVDWVCQHEGVLGKSGYRLRFQLHSLVYFSLLRKNTADATPIKALQYAKTWIAPLAGHFPEDVQTLMGLLAYSPNLNQSPYARIMDSEEMWAEAEAALVAAYCSVHGLPRQSALELCVSIGTVAWPKISKVLSLMRDRPGVDWNPQEELPVEVDSQLGKPFHSVFVCPVLKQQSTETNPPMMMPCGHVICLEALTRLSKGNPNYRMKCPYCPAESTASMALKLIF